MNCLTKLHPGLSAIRNRRDLLDIIHYRLKEVFPFYGISISLLNEDGRTQSNFIQYCRIEGYVREDLSRVRDTRYPVEDGFFDVTLESAGPVFWNIADLLRRKDVPEYVAAFGANGIHWVMGLSLRIDNKAIGCLFFLSGEPFALASTSALGSDDVDALETVRSVADQLSFGVINILANEELVERENEKTILLGISEDMSAIRNKNDLLTVLHERLKKIFYISHTVTILIDPLRRTYTGFVFDPKSLSRMYPEYTRIATQDYSLDDPLMQLVLVSKGPALLDLDVLMEQPGTPEWIKMNYACSIREMVIVQLNVGDRLVGCLAILSDKKGQYNPRQLRLIHGISYQVGVAISNILANEKIERQLEEISRYKQQLEIEKLYLQEEIQTAHNYGEIIGSSPAMRKVFQLVSRVAETTTTVLLMGETGTGKELIARALHNSSSRRDKLMVKVNCATLPTNLIESELFGHERGSFTGAIDRKIGKFELANGSTLFLDEIGELPLDLQAKLLRALQEKEIERIGGRGVIRIDVRIIAATNRDLHKEVQAGNFRSDLFYRLNVFPITIPPLRQRKEDIANLATHFLLKHAKKGKGPMNFSSKVLKQLTAYHWPGNVRELEHLIERSMLLNTGTTITAVHLPVTEREELKQLLPDAYIKTIDEVEREHIISVLKLCNGKVAGIGGAAEKLRIPSTTLTSKIRRLNIRKGYLDE